MDPTQQPGLPPPTTNPYEFILNPQKPQKPKPLQGSMMRLLLIVGSGVTALVIFLVVIVAFLNSNKSSVTEDMVGLTQIQNEIIRVSHQGTSDSVQQTTKNLAVTTEYALLTQQTATINYLATYGRKLAPKEVALKQNAQTDQQFALAKSTSTFDLVFSQVMQNTLTDYAASLKQVFNRTTNPDTKALLSDYYEQTQLLISQVPYAQEQLDATATP